jgi:hypothetical protein
MLPNKNLQQRFEFTKPLLQKGVRDLRIQYIHAGDLKLTGTAELIEGRWDEEDGRIKYNIDFDSIEWNGVNVLDLLEINDVKGSSLLDECYDAAYAHADYLFAKLLNAA